MKSLTEEQLHAFVDGELSDEGMREVEAVLAEDSTAMAKVAVWQEQKHSLHALHDPVLTEAHGLRVGVTRRWPIGAIAASIATLVAGLGAGWFGHGWYGQSENQSADAARAFAKSAAVAHAAFVPEVRHPVEVTADQEAHLVAWLSKRLEGPVRVPHLGPAGWDLLGGRLLPAEAGPVAQFMYQDSNGRRLTLLLSQRLPAQPRASAFRYEQRDRISVFYWVDGAYNYALSADLPRAELLTLADVVYRELSRN
jgi:anti-sigma factor RsiW